MQRPVLGFLLRLDKVTAHTAPGRQAVSDEVTLEVVLRAELMTLEDIHEDVDSTAMKEAETEAASVNRRVSLERGRFPETVVRLSKGDAWAEASD